MNNNSRPGCRQAMDSIYEYFGEESIPLVERLRLQLHLFFCPYCAEEFRKLQAIHDMLHAEFFPPAPSFEDSVMEQIKSMEQIPAETIPEAPGGFSFRAWIVIGFFVFISLLTSFFGIDFIKAAFGQSSSFLVPLGITVGIVLTIYGALFIGSHLKELSTHFKLHSFADGLHINRKSSEDDEFND
ncbi:MAG: peptidoglycan-binding protein [Treponema sp.]|jgi:hypothetical protein|nr:peptidoglycan-binding protein [Treponema sp.]